MSVQRLDASRSGDVVVDAQRRAEAPDEESLRPRRLLGGIVRRGDLQHGLPVGGRRRRRQHSTTASRTASVSHHGEGQREHEDDDGGAHCGDQPTLRACAPAPVISRHATVLREQSSESRTRRVYVALDTRQESVEKGADSRRIDCGASMDACPCTSPPTPPPTTSSAATLWPFSSGCCSTSRSRTETAFAGPLKIEERIGSIDAATIAGYDPEAFAEAFKTRPPSIASPARWPVACSSCARRSPGIGTTTRRDLDPPLRRSGGRPNGAEVLARPKALPGFGEQKAKIFLALLGKRCEFDGTGWREASAPYGEGGSFRSVADIVSPESLRKVREHKRAMKAAAEGSDGRDGQGCRGAHRRGDTCPREDGMRRRWPSSWGTSPASPPRRGRAGSWASARITTSTGPAGEGDVPVLGFAPRKAASTIYFVDEVGPYEDDLADLGPHTTGVGCLYLKDLEKVDMTVLRRILTESYRTMA